jgi:16S rRNA (guanine(966)-N(2))-methyltransferase RsmD
MRVIAGKYRSRQLVSVPGEQTRPTYDRLRETLFNVLQGSMALQDAAVLDLYAGSGAIGIEALSRGAGCVHFVEKERKAAAIIRRNLTQLGIGKEKTEAAVIHETPAAAALRRLSESGTRFALIFLDPPYALEREYRQTLEKIAASSLLAEGGLAVAEHEKFYDPGAEFGGLRRFRLLTQGNSCLSFYRLQPETPATGEAAPL